MHYNYRAEFDLTIWKFNSTIDTNVVAEVMQTLREPDMQHGSSRWFADLSEVERIDINFDRIADFVKFDKRFLDPRIAVRAAVLVSTPLAFGVVRMYQTLMSDTNLDLRILHHRNDCADFLDVPLHVLMCPKGADKTA